MKIVIIGNGTAGNEAAFSLKKYNPEIEVTIISKEGFPEYDPCSLTYFIGKDKPREVVFRRGMESYKEAKINLALGDAADTINTQTRTVRTISKTEHKYDKLILAYGGGLFVPPIKGVDKEGVFGCKQLVDADHLFNRKGKAAVVIGSGAIGIEVAEALKKRGYEVIIIELLNWILPTMFDEIAGQKLGNAMESYGISVHTGEKVVSIEGDTKVESIITNKREIPCDTVVLATGVVVSKVLPDSADIKIDRGIIVNEQMETNVKDIYACGDCVQTRDLVTGDPCVYQLKHNAIDQALVVAQNIIGNPAKYQGAYAFARAHFFNTHSATFGKTEQAIKGAKGIEIIEKDSDGNYLKVILKNGKVIGAQAIGEFADQIGLLMAASLRKDNINEIRREWPNVCRINSNYSFSTRRLGVLLGLDFFPQ